jgi:hypothetical protein
MKANDFGAIDRLVADVIGNLPESSALCVYVFGSVLSVAAATDVDVLVVYPDDRRDLGHAAAEALRASHHIPHVEVLAMSNSEEVETTFIAQQGAVRISHHPGSVADTREN